jgi:hypothetical protein
MAGLLELKPEVEAAAQVEAQAQGLPIVTYIQSFLERTLPRIPSAESVESIRRQRTEILGRLQGKYAGLGSSEEFAGRKADEKVHEEHPSDEHLP